MAKVLIIDDEPQILEVFELILEGTGVDLIKANSGNSAIELLKSDSTIDLVFCDYRMDDGNGSIVFQWMKKNAPNKPFVLVSTYDPQTVSGFEGFAEKSELYFYVNKPFNAEKIISLVERLTKNKSEFENYIRVKLERIKKLKGDSKFSIYLKLHEEKLVKIIDESDPIDFDIVERYIRKGVIWSYVERAAAEILMQEMIEETLQLFVQMKQSNSIELKTELLNQSHENVRELVQTLGLSASTFRVVEATVQATMDYVEQTKGINQLLRLLESKDSFISRHGILSSYLAISLLSKMDWDTKEMRKKFGIACLFQNISLDFEYLASIYGKGEDRFEKLHYKEKNLVLEHPRRSMEFLEKAQMFDSDVLNLILVHHECPNGDGFPRGIDVGQIGVKEGLMILASHLASSLLQNPGSEVSVIAQDFNEIYNKGSLKKVYRSLLQVFLQDYSD
ncbi:MAG: hypothetical protein Fur0010_05470 [Bdellovibrio sp.]